ncbi:MAG: hypothetical protein EAZ39_11885 [Oscillatoriales cyanobacterium]|nr:hypothetical protein [Microcoleus sp. PH2017_05_CCC_O_A]MCC3585161.1 hypothetical protein [Microcoleus sp. PH2017_30_WIL_O_A]TAG18220.1 MAG: hypothetical protein EAZ39_11885 [Oscillatoriales cyanobacterium]
MELSQTYTYYFNSLTCVHQTENELYIMGRETTIVLNFQQTSYQTLDQIIHALRLVRDKKIQDRKSILEQELLALNFQFTQESSNRSNNGSNNDSNNGSSNGTNKNCELKIDW